MSDGNRVHNWRSAQYQFENSFDYKFDTDYDGNADNTINIDKLHLYNNNNDKAIKEFEVWVKISNGNWQQIDDTFTAQKNTTLQEFELDDIENVSDFRIKTLSNYGNSYYIEAKEFEIIGQNPNTHHTFTAQKNTTLQEFELDDIENISDLRIKIISNYGNYYHVEAKEFELYGTPIGPKYTFEAAKISDWQTFSFQNASGKLFRFHTQDTYGNYYHMNIREITLLSTQKAVFNAVNQNNGCFNWDNNITTKITGTPINLTILSGSSESNTTLTDSNITKIQLLNFSDSGCSLLYHTHTVWQGNDTVDEDGCFALPTFIYDKAIKCAKIKISGISSGNLIESNSSDTFSIRPNKFVLANIPLGKLTAEHDYTFKAKAVNIDGLTATVDFNTSVTPQSKKYFRDDTNGSMIDGTFVPTSDFTFTDGLSANTTLSFNNVGKIGLELNDTTWAEVDNDDTPLSDRTIYLEQNLTFIPHHFDINFTLTPNMSNYGNNPFTYYASDLTNMGAKIKHLNFTVVTRGENGGKMTNYQDDAQNKYFANDINFSLGLTVEKNPNITPEINESQTKNLGFNAGIATLTYADLAFNYGRERNVTKNPSFLEGSNSDINITITDYIDTVVKGDKLQPLDGNATFYYGRVRAEDIKTSQTPVNAKQTIQIYSTTPLNGFKQVSNSWYLNKLDSFSYVKKRAEDKRKLTALTVDNSTVTNGINIFSIIANPIDKSYRKFYHLSIPAWLWYSKYENYNFTTDTTCAQHPCFEYIFESADKTISIKSSDYNSTKFKNNFNSGSKKKAIKLLR
jgi:hypothetical protein